MMETVESAPKKGRRKQTSPGPGIYRIIAMIIVWAGLVFGGFWYAADYAQRTVREIQETNAMNVKMLEEDIQSLHLELNAVREALAEADATISSAGSAGEAVNERITQLDEQLKKLEQSLNIMMESGNEDY